MLRDFPTNLRTPPGYGWTVPEPTFHWPTLIANKDREIARLEAAYTSTLERYNVALVKSRAVLEDAHTVRLATGARVRAETILISTGAWPHWDRKFPASSTRFPRTKLFICRTAKTYRGPGRRLYCG